MTPVSTLGLGGARSVVPPRCRGVSVHVRMLVLLSGLVGVHDSAVAHKLQLFAFAEGSRIAGSVYFAGGGAARGVQVEVRDDSGALLATLTPTDDGAFDYRAASPVDHQFVAISPDGHRAQWRVRAAELGAPVPAGDERLNPANRVPEGIGRVATAEAPMPQDPSADGDAMNTQAREPLDAGVLDQDLDPLLEQAIERVVARQIHPLREALVEAEDQVRLRDILGGFGYILGLTGLALWWTCRAGRRPH